MLGPIEVLDGGKPLDIGRPKQRCVLGALLTEPNRLVPTTRLIERVWGEDPPDSARNVLYGHIGRLKTALGADGEDEATLARRSGGYQLTVDPNTVDLHRFRRLVVTARNTDDDRRVAALLDEAHALWRGPAFADVSSSWLLNLRTTLENERISTLIDRNESFIRLNRSTEILSELHDLARYQPLDERIARQLIIALHQSGKKADALIAFATLRSHLVEEVGLDPSPSLQVLEKQILTGDPALHSSS
ncbi:hypothetical protein GCM10023192_81190 [Amycolatopsis samaneae]